MWKQLTTNDLKKILSQDELDTLESVSVDPSLSSVVQDGIDLVADMFRGAFIAKGYKYDIRDHYVPSTYALPVLQYSRVVVWSRFPNSPAIALDEVRKKENERLQDLLKDPYIGAEDPDWEHSSENPEATGKDQAKGTITLPFLRFDDQLYYWKSLSCL